MPFRTPQEVEQVTQTYNKYLSYITTTISYDDFLGSKMGFEQAGTPGSVIFSPDHGKDVSVRFDSDEEAFSRRFQRPVEVTFWLTYAVVQPEEWWFAKSNGKPLYPDSMNKGEAFAHVWFYDANTRERISVEKLPPAPLPQFIQSLKSYLMGDLSFDQGGGNGPQDPAPPMPEPTGGKTVPVPVEKEEPEMALAWVRKNCRFAR